MNLTTLLLRENRRTATEPKDFSAVENTEHIFQSRLPQPTAVIAQATIMEQEPAGMPLEEGLSV